MSASPFRSFLPMVPLAAALLAASLFTGCRTTPPQSFANPAAVDQPTFALIDATGDGKVSPAEMAAFQHKEGLAEVDLDNDKRVSLLEWKAVRPGATGDGGTFEGLDLNQDGYLSEEEAIAHITAQASYRTAFREMDADGDGHLHWEEYAAGDAASLNVALASGGVTGAQTETVGQ